MNDVIHEQISVKSSVAMWFWFKFCKRKRLVFNLVFEKYTVILVKLLSAFSANCNTSTNFFIYVHRRRDVLGWLHTCNVTAYHNTVSWQCGRDSWPRNISNVGCAVTLEAFSVYCRYLAVTSKGWYGYGRSRCRRATRDRVTYQKLVTR